MSLRVRYQPTGWTPGEPAGDLHNVIGTSTGSSITTATASNVGEVAPFHVEDFGSYSTTAELTAASDDPMSGEPSVKLITNDGPPGGSGHSFMQTYEDVSANTSTRCDNTGVSDFRKYFPEKREVWMRVWYKFSPNWISGPDPSWECVPASPDFKCVFFRGRILDGGSVTQDRWQFKHGQGGTPTSSGFNFASPNMLDNRYQSGSDVNAADEWDGNWHDVRMHMRGSSAVGEADGYLEAWIGELKVFDSGPFNVEHWIDNYQLGLFRNHGAREEMTVSFGMIKLWDQDPGWNS